MYTLVIEQHNFTENLFFPDSELFDSSKSSVFMRECLDKCNIKHINLSSNRLYDGEKYIQIGMFSPFNSIEQAELFSLTMSIDVSEYRLLTRKWNSEHLVLTKAHIIDENNNIVKTLTDCEQHVCQRFDGQCSSDGCTKVEYTASLKNKKIIPIVSA